MSEGALPRNLLIVTATSTVRGAEAEASELAQRLSAIGITTTLRSVEPGDPPRFAIEALGTSAFSPTGLSRLRRHAARSDLVIAFGSRSLPACSIAMLGLTTPFIYRSIGDPTAWLRGPVHRCLTSLQYRRPIAVAALWPTARTSIIEAFGVASDRVVVVPNARSREEYPPIQPADRARAKRSMQLESTPVAAFVGRLQPEKGVALAIETIAGLDSWHLLVAGHGVERSAAEKLASRVAPGRVTFLGHVPSVAPVLAAADVLLISSSTEGMPGVAIEALMLGLPVVSTPVGALPEMRGVAISDPTPEALGDGLVAATMSPRQRPGGDAFAWESVLPKWLALLSAVSQGRSPNRQGA